MNMKRSLGVLLLLLAIPAVAAAQDKASFAGKWTGEWKNSLGEKGAGILFLEEDSSGKVKGTWGDELLGVIGKRVNKNTIELQGRTENRSFQGTATVKGDTMTLRFLVARLGRDDEGAFDSSATLKRSK